jgi:hypothetical protein
VTQSTLTQGLVTRNRPVQELVVAVDPEEVARLTEALAVNAEIACVPRSGRPDDPVDSHTPDLQPWSPFWGPSGSGTPTSSPLPTTASQGPPLNMVERINGDKREMLAIPSRPGGR